MIHAILNPLTKSDIIVYQIDCQFIKERNLLPVFPERQHSIMAAHDTIATPSNQPAVAVHDVAEYEPGTKRYRLTKEKTDSAFRDFIAFIKSEQASNQCKCFFMGKI